MSELTVFNGTTLILDIGTIIMLIGLMMVTNVLRRRGRDDDKLFYYMLVVGIILSIGDIIGYLTEGKSFYGVRFVQLFGMELFYMSYILISMLWMQYTRARFGEYRGDEENLPAKNYYYYPALLTLALVVVNFTTGWMFSVDEDNVYQYGPIYAVLHIVFFSYIIYGFVKMVRYRSANNNRRLIPLWIYLLPIIVGLIVTFGLRGISMTPAGVMLSIVFTHLGSMNDVSDPGIEEGVL